MNLADPETRRGLRAFVGAVLALALIALVWTYAGGLVDGSLAALLQTSLAIIAVRVLFDGAENVTNAIRFSVGPIGITGDVGAPGQAAQKVADTAQVTANEIKADDVSATVTPTGVKP